MKKFGVFFIFFIFLFVSTMNLTLSEVLFEDDFETGNFNKWDEIEPGRNVIISDDCPQGNYCHFCNLSWPTYDAMWVYLPEDIEQVYISFWQKLSPNFAFGMEYPGDPDTGGDHYWRIYSRDWNGQLDSIWETNFGYQFYMGDSVEYDFAVSQQEFILGEWQFFEVFLKLNTIPDQGGLVSDGIVQTWIDYKLVLNNTHAYMRGDLNRTWGRFALTTNYDQNGPGENNSCYWVFDDVKIFSDLPEQSSDTTAPVRSNGGPSGILISGTTQTTLNLSTNENATCKYATSSGVEYESMLNPFLTTDSTSHSTIITGLNDGENYNYFVRCTDSLNNSNIDDYFINFSVANFSVNECDSWQFFHPEWIWCDNFENFSLLDEYFEYDDDDGEFIRVFEQGLNNSYAMRALWQVGEQEAGNLKKSFGRTPASYFNETASRENEDFDDIYWRMFVRTQQNWQGGQPAKLSRATIFANSNWAQAMISHVWGMNNYNLGLDPATGIDSSGNLVTTTYNDFANLDWLGAESGTTDLFSTENSDEWYCIEAHAKLNTPGQLNGINELWINNNLEVGVYDLNWRNTWDDYGINSVFFENYWNDGSPVEQARYFDNLVISTERIGCQGGSSCSLEYDTSPCNCLTNIELGNGVNAWFRGELGIGDLMQHLNLWRTNSSC